MDKNLLAHIEYLLCIRILNARAVAGGDISKAYRLETETESFFCKLHEGADALNMFQTERAGLETVALTKTIATPKVLLCDALEKGAFLLMEYIEPKNPSAHDMELFGHQLATMHLVSDANKFGWQRNNFIGSLPQSNKRNSDWSEFYVRERLVPQLRMAYDLTRLPPSEIPSEERLLKTCGSLFPTVGPALLHGDLWNGNYLIAQDGSPYLIDPAVYYGHHEVDLAMTRLFGGFGTVFYEAYSSLLPPSPLERERTDIYQLYYLLVHLNLFGPSYYRSVSSILKRYFLD